MTKINADKEKITPKAPVGTKYVSYCTLSGDLPGEHCGEEVSSCWFASHNVPKKICKNLHKTEEELAAEQQDGTDIPEEITVPGEEAPASENETAPIAAE